MIGQRHRGEAARLGHTHELIGRGLPVGRTTVRVEIDKPSHEFAGVRLVTEMLEQRRGQVSFAKVGEDDYDGFVLVFRSGGDDLGGFQGST